MRDTEITTSSLGAALVDFVVDRVEELVAKHLPGLRIPGTFAGHRIEPDVAADLVFTLGWLAEAGVSRVTGFAIDDAIAIVLGRIDGRRTHTFFSYRVAETLARFGSFADNRLLEQRPEIDRDNVALACDSSDWIALLDQGLPRNYAAVLARCEAAREALGLVDGTAVEPLVQRVRALLADNPHRYLDDSTHRVGRYDIYTADIWLFTEPLAPRLGPVWEEGLAAALAMVRCTGSRDGTAVAWGRSTGMLSVALTIELAALAVARGYTGEPALWLRRAADALAGMPAWFRDGLAAAHQHRSPYDYRGPFRRLQLTLDVLGKLAWSAATLLRAEAAVASASAIEAYPWHDELVRFADSAAAVWSYRTPALEFTLPLVGASRSDYLAAPHCPGVFEVPVDSAIPCWLPLVVAHDKTWTAAGVPAQVEHQAGTVTAHWNDWVLSGELDPPAASERAVLSGGCVASWRVEGCSLCLRLDLSFAAAPDAVSVLVPEVAGRPLAVELLGASAGHLDVIDVDGIKEWRSFWSSLARVHQVDLDPACEHGIEVRVTPTLRIASTAHGHHYDRCLYEPLAGRAVSLPAPIGPFADRSVSLRDIDLLHLHWPEWFAFDDIEAHRRLAAELRQAGVPVVWTAHNLTPHEKKPEIYEPIYQLWAGEAAAIVHHSAWGEGVFRQRYATPPATRHVVLPHGHFGELYPRLDSRDRRQIEAEMGLRPCEVRIGILGAPRHEKKVAAFLRGVAACQRDDVQVVCWSLTPGELEELGDVLGDPRIAIAEAYEMVEAEVYARRLAVCDALALPFDPAGEMLATGVAADALGYGLPALISDWGYLVEVMGAAGIGCGHTAGTVAAALDGLTPEALAAARAASLERRPHFAWTAIAERSLRLFEEVVVAAAAERRR